MKLVGCDDSTMRNFKQIQHPVYICSLVILLLNDLIFKSLFHNYTTGKLSDIVGPIVFVGFLQIFIKKKWAYGISVIWFVIWKSHLIDPLIELWNSTNIFTIARVIDYADLICLFVLIPYYHSEKIRLSAPNFLRIPILFIAVFSFFATSRASHFPLGPEVFMNEIINIRKSEGELITTLKTNSTLVQKTDSTYVIEKDTFQAYWIQDLILEKDTIREAKIGIKSFPKKCKVYIDQIILKDENQIYGSFKDFKRTIKTYKASFRNTF